jgi:pSer/pThr/pTyr-binding forkhead associated (FHA) protein
VELETKDQYGLMVILMRHSKFNELADKPSLDPVSYKAAKHISLTPFTQIESRAFVRWRINVEESADLGRILDFAAVTLIHELCDGMPDAIERLCCESLQMADDEDTAPVTTDIVMRASKALQLQPMSDQPTSSTRLAAAPDKSIPTLQLPKAPKIVVKHKGKTIRELPFTQQRISIGRSTENDVCIESPFVSRQHATIFRNGAETAVVDLDSKNGTFVNSKRVQVQTIADKDEINIGYHSIQFHDPNTPRIRSMNSLGRSGKSLIQESNSARPVQSGDNAGISRRQDGSTRAD